MAKEKKPAPKKPAPKKKKAPAKKKPTLISYAIKMTIPTGQYANIQPEVIVKSGSMEEAHDFIAPHMNKLWKEYYLVNERRPAPVQPAPAPKPVTPAPVQVKPVEPAPKPVTPAPAPAPTPEKSTVKMEPAPAPVKPEPVDPNAPPFKGDEFAKKPEVKEEQPPISSVAYAKATQAIESCLSVDAFNLIVAQVEKSVKLTEEDKKNLQPLLGQRFDKLVKE